MCGYMSESLKRESMRTLWKESGYDYSVLTKDNLYVLARYLNHELHNYIKSWEYNCNDPNAWLHLHYLKGHPFWCN